jgi:hypothetical protein
VYIGSHYFVVRTKAGVYFVFIAGNRSHKLMKLNRSWYSQELIGDVTTDWPIVGYQTLAVRMMADESITQVG